MKPKNETDEIKKNNPNQTKQKTNENRKKDRKKQTKTE